MGGGVGGGGSCSFFVNERSDKFEDKNFILSVPKFRKIGESGSGK